MAGTDADDDAVDEAALDAARRQLYRLAPEQFLDARAELVAATGDATLANAIGRLRKPTQPAWIVNAFVAEHGEAVQELATLGAELAQAQAELDTARLRELTLQRRRAVARVTGEALDAAGRAGAAAAVREAVGGTFDAAVADPEVAAQLGALQRPRTWSGFGPVATTALTVVRDAPTPTRNRKTSTSTRTRKARDDEHRDDDGDDHPPDTTAERAALEAATAELAGAEAAEHDLQATLRRLTTKLTTLQHQIADVRHELDDARHRTTAARRGRRAQQSALDRKQRAAGSARRR